MVISLVVLFIYISIVTSTNSEKDQFDLQVSSLD